MFSFLPYMSSIYFRYWTPFSMLTNFASCCLDQMPDINAVCSVLVFTLILNRWETVTKCQSNKFCYCRNRRRALWRKHSILKFSHICHSYYNTFYDSLLFIMYLLRSSLFNLYNAAILYNIIITKPHLFYFSKKF